MPDIYLTYLRLESLHHKWGTYMGHCYAIALWHNMLDWGF